LYASTETNGAAFRAAVFEALGDRTIPMDISQDSRLNDWVNGPQLMGELVSKNTSEPFMGPQPIASSPMGPSFIQPSEGTYGGKRYQLTAAKTWADAQAEAFRLGGHLVTINDAAEEAWLRRTFGQNTSLWMGLSDHEKEGTFRWASGEASTYRNWAQGQPNNHPAAGGEDYAVLSYEGISLWNDVSSSAKYRGIMEFDVKQATQPSPAIATQLEDRYKKAGSNGLMTQNLGRVWGQNNFSIRTETSGKQTATGFQEFSNQILRVNLPAGSASPAVSDSKGRPVGGGEFLDPLKQAPVDRLQLSYKLRFSDNFDFVKGGKLPGLYGGTAPSGGYIPNGSDGFSTRFMWREGGKGEVYAYLPSSAQHGTSLGKGNWQFKPGVWYNLKQEVILNDPKSSNGSLRVWLDNQLVLDQKNMRFRTTEKLKIDGVYVSAFFGGGSADYATPKNVHIDFDDFKVSAVNGSR
jgi:hypothetical protein